MSTPLKNIWDNKYAENLKPEELLQYRSNLLGSDLRITNYGGGNTSAKITQVDPLNQKKEVVLWVKGSGGDLGSINLDGFATLYLKKLEQLKSLYQGLKYEDEMVGYLSHCTFNVNTRAASIDTPLHAFIPYDHVDHMHPDSIIAIACTENSKFLTQKIFDGQLGWLPWQRPGFDLGLKLNHLVISQPQIKGVILAGHGLFTWGTTSKHCYQNTIETIQKAEDWLRQNNSAKKAFGGMRYASVSSSKRQNIVSTLMPILRGKIINQESKIGHFNGSKEVLEFVNSKELSDLATLGTSCPDHFLRTKIYPLVIDFHPQTKDIDDELNRCIEQLDKQLDQYRQDYTNYYSRCKQDGSPAMRDSNPVVYLIPGVGMITFAKNKETARISGEFYINAINVMREANRIGKYQGLCQQEAFNIEYWLLEEAKLQRMPPPKQLSGQVAFITGGAGGIGRATASRLLREGACIVLADIDQKALNDAKSHLIEEYGQDVVRCVLCDVTKEYEVIDAIRYTSREYGGLDILVCNAGIASSSPIDETSLDMWNFNMEILSTGYFLTVREGFKLFRAQNVGGSIVFIGSKNGLVASPNAAAYCTAKAAEIQLARSIALEGAPLGIRCNVVNPDAVLRGSKIWTGQWRQERASAYNLQNEELEEHYRKRSLLKRNVFPEDIAEAVFFLASNLSSKSTGNIVNVDAGNASAFTR